MLREYIYLEDLDSDKVGPYTIKLDSNCFPFYLNDGLIYTYQKSTKDIKSTYLPSHYWIFNWRDKTDNDDGHKKYFMQNYQLGRYWECMKSILLMEENKQEYYEKLGKEALKHLNIDVSEEAFRKSNNTSLVLTVERLRDEHEKKVLLGHISAILEQENIAQDFFTDSSKPHLALELRSDLQDWNIALKLAKDYQPHREPFISRKIAYQYEKNENISEALKMYEKSLIVDIPVFIQESEEDVDKDGIFKFILRY